jgi:propionyl-CoA carboxylase alpha chain
VVRVDVAVGDKVSQGQPLLWLEAMKMEHTISAPADGVVAELAVAAGQQVDLGAVLAVVQEVGTAPQQTTEAPQGTATEEEQ